MTDSSFSPGKVLLLEDNPRDAELLTDAILSIQPDCAVLVATGQAEFSRALEAFSPDVVLSDHGIPGFSSLDALRLTQKVRPGVPVILVSGNWDRGMVQVLKAGAADAVMKEDLTPLLPAISRALKDRAPLQRLTERQVEVLRLLTGGASMREIARLLRLSVKTVETHRAEVLKRLGLRDLTGLVRFAIRLGLIPSET